MANYDEDLHENHFFKVLVETNNALYNKAADNKWLVSSNAMIMLNGVMHLPLDMCAQERYCIQAKVK